MVIIVGMDKLPGVYQAKKKDGVIYFRASITYKRKHISLGSFSDEFSAHQAYICASKLIDVGSSMNIEHYSDEEVLSFDKWVIIINFRDNGIYFGTPIYIRPHYFYYYYEQQCILKFDIDDLFYFSSHKIMCRGNHYFVADYGMQVNIATRYGIKNYAVPGIDYNFRNGDSTDFRRENIEILNIYHGVRAITKNKHIQYSARIHVNGYYHIGVYSSMQEAAIAYNKAIDILYKKGVKKNFTTNYIENLSPSLYADIYSKLQISAKLLNYSPLN